MKFIEEGYGYKVGRKLYRIIANLVQLSNITTPAQAASVIKELSSAEKSEKRGRNGDDTVESFLWKNPRRRLGTVMTQSRVFFGRFGDYFAKSLKTFIQDKTC